MQTKLFYYLTGTLSIGLHPGSGTKEADEHRLYHE